MDASLEPLMSVEDALSREVVRKLRLAAEADTKDDREIICEELFCDITGTLDAHSQVRRSCAAPRAARSPVCVDACVLTCCNVACMHMWRMGACMLTQHMGACMLCAFPKCSALFSGACLHVDPMLGCVHAPRLFPGAWLRARLHTETLA
eukprot:350700-Chlamydomonas_euryale.AAC.8